MALGTLSETITVSGDSPMLEVARPSNVLNIDAQFQKALPLVEGKYWSDFLHMTPGVMSRPHNDGSGRQNYFGNAVDHRDAVVDMEGMMASNYNDSNINRTALSTFTRYHFEQGLSKRLLMPDELFAPESLESFKI